MEPLLEQAVGSIPDAVDVHTSFSSSSSSSNSRQLGLELDKAKNTNAFDDLTLQEELTLYFKTISNHSALLSNPHHSSSQPSSSAVTTECNTAGRTEKGCDYSAQSTITALDIAALRESLRNKPKLRRVCHICGRECPSRHKLQRHLSTHTEERPYNCTICGKAFKWTEYLSKHMKTQHGSGSTNVSKAMRKSSTSSSSPISSPATTSSNSQVKTSHSNERTSSTSSVSSGLSDGIQPEKNATLQAQMRPLRRNDSSSTSGFSSQSQTPPAASDVFSSNQTTFDGNLNISGQVNSSSPLMQDQLSLPYTGGYYNNNFQSMYNQPFPCHYTGYGPVNGPQYMCQQPMPFNNEIFSFDSSYQSFMPQQTLNPSHSINMGSNIMTTNNTYNNSELTPSNNNSSNNVSCQTQEQKVDTPPTVTTKKPPVRIINLCSIKKDIGIQCEVGDETLQALFEAENESLCSSESHNNIDNLDTASFDEGFNCVRKYPCEFEGCQRAYVHCKDLRRHMKITHGSSPKLLQSRIIESPAKPYICCISDCGKSYYHLKDLRRHQRHCHISITSSDEDGSMIRYPCDFMGCKKSYIHKKDLIRHKKMVHQDNSSNLTDLMQTSSKTDSEGEERLSKYARMENPDDFINEAQLSMNDQPLDHTGDLASFNVSNIMDNLSAAVATMFDMDSSIFPVGFSDISSTSTDPTLHLITNQSSLN
jgi:hypothetical protein